MTDTEEALYRAARAGSAIQIELCKELIHTFAFGIAQGHEFSADLRAAVQALSTATDRYRCVKGKAVKTPRIQFESMFRFLFGNDGCAVAESVEQLSRVTDLLAGIASDREAVEALLTSRNIDPIQAREILETFDETEIVAGVAELQWACSRFFGAYAVAKIHGRVADKVVRRRRALDEVLGRGAT